MTFSFLVNSLGLAACFCLDLKSWKGVLVDQLGDRLCNRWEFWVHQKASCCWTQLWEADCFLGIQTCAYDVGKVWESQWKSSKDVKNALQFHTKCSFQWIGRTTFRKHGMAWKLNFAHLWAWRCTSVSSASVSNPVSKLWHRSWSIQQCLHGVSLQSWLGIWSRVKTRHWTWTKCWKDVVFLKAWTVGACHRDGQRPNCLETFSDADWSGSGNQRSTSSAVHVLNGQIVHSSSRTQKCLPFQYGVRMVCC